MSNVDIKASITYTGSKAVYILAGSHRKAFRELVADLDVLRIPIPREGDLRRIPPNSLYISWRTVIGSYLHRRCRAVRDGEISDSVKRTLSIDKINISEKPVTDSKMHAKRTRSLSPLRPRSPRPHTHYQRRRTPVIDRDGSPVVKMSKTSLRNLDNSIETFRRVNEALQTSMQKPEDQKEESKSLSNSGASQPAMALTDSLAQHRKTENASPHSRLLEPYQESETHRWDAVRIPPSSDPNYLTITRLSRELSTNHSNLISAHTRESELLSALQNLDASVPPETLENDANVDAEMCLRELGSERWQRIAADRALQDIADECRLPFACSELSKAFVWLSGLTDRAELQD